MPEIQTVTGTTTPEKLGKTLMHEHLFIGYPGSDVDWVNRGRRAASASRSASIASRR
jgi:predicted metal-dependent phosphotriesterase family hydrolase